MVTIVDYRTYHRKDGSEFHALVVQGGVEAIKSNETGRTYLTANTAKVPCTFDENTCLALKGTTLPGGVRKVDVEPYEYAIPSSGEIIHLTHRYEYVSQEEGIINKNVIDSGLVV
jgi:hypothetical protein